jgi:phosphate transport system permease protein
MPMQIFGWADRPDEAWRLNAAFASVFLLLTLLLMNGLAIYLRQRGQRHIKW